MGRNLSQVTESRATVTITADHSILSGEILLLDTTAGTILTLISFSIVGITTNFCFVIIGSKTHMDTVAQARIVRVKPAKNV